MMKTACRNTVIGARAEALHPSDKGERREGGLKGEMRTLLWWPGGENFV